MDGTDVDWGHWSEFDALEVWKLTALTIGLDPDRMERYVDRDGDPLGLNSRMAMIRAAVAAGTLTRLDAPHSGEHEIPESAKIGTIQFATWARKKRWEVGDRLAPSTPGLDVATWLQPSHKYYSRELHAAIDAFRSLMAAEKQFDSGRSPKQQIEKWLKQNYQDLPNAAIERISTLINPSKEGGAPPTS